MKFSINFPLDEDVLVIPLKLSIVDFKSTSESLYLLISFLININSFFNGFISKLNSFSIK